MSLQETINDSVGLLREIMGSRSLSPESKIVGVLATLAGISELEVLMICRNSAERSGVIPQLERSFEAFRREFDRVKDEDEQRYRAEAAMERDAR